MPAAAGPDRVPEVDAVLARLGLGRLGRSADLAAFPGRNDNWAGRTDRGYRVFVKRIGGSPVEARQRFRRSVTFERRVAGRCAAIAPRSLGWDEPARLLVSELIDNAASGADLAADGRFGPELAARAGQVIGSLHRLPADEIWPGEPPGDGRPALPSEAMLRGLSWPTFCACSAGELRALRLMQDDEVLASAVGGLLGREARAPRVPAHCDLRLDQFLLAEDHLYVTDWEEFRFADAARDVGSFAGEWLFRAVTGWADPAAALEPGAGLALEPGAQPRLSHQDIVRKCAEGLEQARPAISAFWSGYCAARPRHDHELAARAAAFAGWHLFDRLLAVARQAVRLGAVHRAAAGIGRAIMRAPAESAVTIGLD
jgi:hypothetical protein